MWTHCLVCTADLGRNEEVEHFQLGERLAYDPERGRLWVICPRCARWSLTPLEARWEALEDLERLWESAPAKVQGEEIALARLRSGLRVVRVGRASAPEELAIWRWGRRARAPRAVGNWAGGAAIAGAAGTLFLVSPMAGLAAVGALGYVAFLSSVSGIAGGLPVPLERAGDVTTLTRAQIRNAGMNPSDDELGWSIHLERPVAEMKRSPLVGQQIKMGSQRLEWVEFKGADALSIARRAFPLLNRRHSPERVISDAIDLVAQAGGAEDYLRVAAGKKPRWVKFLHYPEPLRLSLEMVLFQEEERRALEGELGRLEEAWSEAERIAEISDNLLPPRGWWAFRRRALGEGPDA